MDDSLTLKTTITIHQANSLESLLEQMRQRANEVKYVTYTVKKMPGGFYCRVAKTDGANSCEAIIKLNDDPNPALDEMFVGFWSEVINE